MYKIPSMRFPVLKKIAVQDGIAIMYIIYFVHK